MLYLPFKLKANTTLNPLKTIYDRLFLPFKLKANTTQEGLKSIAI